MNKYLTSLLLFLVFLFIYYIGSFAKIPFADCVGFVVETEKGQFAVTATATTHFLYINTTILIKNILSLNAIEANRLLVVFSGAATVSIIFLTLKNLIKTDWVAITSAIVFGFSFSFWKNAEIVEVYTYNTLWISLFFYCIIQNFVQKRNIYPILAGIFLGISLWLHIQNILLIPAYLLFLYYFKDQKKSILLSFLSFTVLFSLLFIINTSQGLPLKSPLSSDQGHWVEDSLKKSFLQYVQDLIKSLFYLIYNFNVFVIFGITGIILLYKANRKMFFVFFTAALLVYGFSTFYAVTDNYVFFLPFNLMFALAIGYGLSSVRFQALKKYSWCCLLIPFFYFSCFHIALRIPQAQNFDNFKKYKGGLEYYMLPWMNNNIGILEFTIDRKKAPEPISWMTISAEEYIEILKSKGLTPNEIREL
ncbi:protein O-mannosyl-transferase family [Chryseobacterium sp. CT-SW4]|uniref:protein O-mannosyl-transferase family n=1 Tax=Chryseobacterium sp. SW-1 TaxID=3157343 RepID=UPI003B0114C7